MKNLLSFTIFIVILQGSLIGATCSKPLLILHLTQTPQDERQHKEWNKSLHSLVDELNKELCSTEGKKELKAVFRKSPKKCFFYARFDYHFGIVTIQVPSNVDVDQAIGTIKVIAQKKALPIEISKDCPISIARDADIGFEGFALSLDELEKLKKGEHLSSHHLPASENEIKEALFWYQKLPTTGLRPQDHNELPPYPFLPHCFNLWELAPSKGRGVKIAIIDTGVAAFPVKGSKKYRKNYDLEMKGHFGSKTYNIVSDDGLDPIEQFIHKLRHYFNEDTFDHEYLEKMTPLWIKECLEHNSIDGLTSYMQNHSSSFGSNDIQSVKRLINKSFNLIQLDEPYGEKAVEQFVPLVQITHEKSTFVAGHGSHGFGVVGGQLSSPSALTPEADIGICGLAPAADIIMIKAFNDDGTSNKSTLIAGLKKAISYNADIVNLSLKISDKVNFKDSSTQLLDRLLGLVPYVVTASGNGKGGEAFPARFETVNFDVGAFRYNSDNYPIISFSQYTKNYGPRIVAPGYNILSCGLVPSQKKDSMYAFMSGTSMAAPIVSGFIALVLGEFKNEFDSQQIQKVIFKSTVRMHDNKDWHDKSLLGVIDMRTALLMFHTLRNVKESIKNNSINYDFNKHFDNILQATHYLLYSMTDDFSKKYLDGVSMENDYATFIKRSHLVAAQKPEILKETHKMINTIIHSRETKLKSVVQYLTDSLLSSLHSKYIPHGPCAKKPIIATLSTILNVETINLFETLPQAAQKRLLHRAPIENYWKDRAHKLQHSAEHS